MSSSLSRRLANRRAEATQKLIVFCIHQTWFTLPIQAAEKVVSLGQVYGAPDGQGLRFTHYQDRQILVIDAKERIFGRREAIKLIAPQQTAELQPSPNADLPVFPPAYLLIVQDLQGESVGIPLDSQPTLRRVPLSAFKPLPTAYLVAGNIRCISALVVIKAESPLFLLNLEQLLQVQTRSLPATLDSF
ncbi:MAG: chemotaxis protein CheW [Oscillatoriophycideae cyanobacterium NC_groundwater_1537_Pr4_S-0.65um_50_18]|nr:chemotaxis protein CheW [Oscillatoriophycideae cyanobacterium NC_groundwater_1537_Pr4_S-0.65um_50_18]